MLLICVGGCTPRTPAPTTAPADPPRLEVAGEYIVPPQTSVDPLNKARFGGISGLALDPLTGDLLGVSDDRKESRFFIFRISGEGPAFRVRLHAYLPLGAADAGSPALLDGEGIAITRAGRVYIASEGVQSVEPRLPPAITIYNRRVDYAGSLPVPQKFIPAPTGAVTRGVRPNAGFESLSITADERTLITATEQPLVQDGEPSSADRGAIIRILEYVTVKGSFSPAREFAYQIDALPQTPFATRTSECGVVEVLAIRASDLLVMERCFAREAAPGSRTQVRIRIYRASLNGASDVSGYESLPPRPQPARKALLLDLSTIGAALSPELRALDNFEGMGFGPALADGSRSLLLVSDDNFSKEQRTAFLLFRIRGEL